MEKFDHDVEPIKELFIGNYYNFEYILKVEKYKNHATSYDIQYSLWLYLLLGTMRHCCFIMSSVKTMDTL